MKDKEAFFLLNHFFFFEKKMGIIWRKMSNQLGKAVNDWIEREFFLVPVLFVNLIKSFFLELNFLTYKVMKVLI